MKFAKSYIAKFQFSTVTSGEFKDYFVEYVRTNGDDAQKSAVQSINWDHIFHNAGMPIHTPDFSTSLKDGPLELAARWIEAADNDVSGFSQADRSGWVTLQNNIFLDKLLESASKKPLSAEKLENMNKIYDFGSVNNCEIKFRWQCLCLSTGVTWIVYAVVTFVKSQGRMKYVRPLYRALNACSKVNGSKIAKTTFIEAYSMYHPIAQKMLANDLSVTAEEIAAASPPVPTLPPKETLTVKSNAVKTSIKVGILRLKNWCFSTWPRLASATGVVAAFSYIFFKRLFKK